MKDNRLAFNEEAHTYQLDGKPIPSVTQILSPFVSTQIGGMKYLVNTDTGFAIDGLTMANRADFGQALHRASELILSGNDLDPEELHEDLVTPIEAFKNFLTEYKVSPVVLEQQYYSTALKFPFAGTLDLVADLFKTRYLIDLKSSEGAGALAGPQTAAYEYLYRGTTGYRGKIVRAVAYLNAEHNQWRLKALKSPYDWKYFRYLLYAHNFKKNIS